MYMNYVSLIQLKPLKLILSNIKRLFKQDYSRVGTHTADIGRMI